MTQNELNRDIARATGESIGHIARQGFSLLGPTSSYASDEREPFTVDWDEVELQRRRPRASARRMA